MPPNDRIGGLIRKLAAITVDNGATPEEAMAAAAKARQLCDQYGLSAEGVDIEEAMEALGRRRYRPIDELWPAVAWYSHCAFFYHHRPSGINAHYLGAPHNIAMAVWLHQMLVGCIKRASEAYKATRSYKRRASHRRRLAAASFVEGMVEALCAKLYARASKEQQQEIAAAKAERDRRYCALEDGPALPCVKRVRPTDSARLLGRKAGRDVTISTPIRGATAPAGLLTGA
ncbi:MAG TPA: DUF2786 domain-containing protein [Azospirillaceae bacterium]|nr:DUF2786 domain-containing protein [Azospirillaceae bacterium]